MKAVTVDVLRFVQSYPQLLASIPYRVSLGRISVNPSPGIPVARFQTGWNVPGFIGLHTAN